MENFSKKHFFDVDLAIEIGPNPAIIFEHIFFWIDKNQANGRHFYDGLYWTYSSINGFMKIFPYMGEKSIRNALKILEDHNLIITGNYNKIGRDRTKWYAISPYCPKGKCIRSKRQMHTAEKANAYCPKGEPLPYIYNTDILDNTNVLSFDQNQEKTNQASFFESETKTSFQKKVARKKSFSIPTLEEVSNYCLERKNTINPEKFYDYYTSIGWTIGKNKPMKDWKATIRNWERNQNSTHGTAQQTEQRVYGRQTESTIIASNSNWEQFKPNRNSE